MTHKQRMLAAIRGEAIDKIPWAPRLDLWYRANRRAGTLPKKYRDASLVEILDDTGMGLHAVVPDFRDLRGTEDDVDRALGIYNLKMMPCRTVLENIERSVRIDGDRTFVEYKTPVGTIKTTVLYNEEMRRAGITITHIEQYAFKSVEDYAPLSYIFENAKVVPNYGGYQEFADFVGNRGIAVAFANATASPMQLIMKELIPFDLFFYEMHDHPDELALLVEKIGSYLDRILDVVTNCPAEVVFLGGNYDASVTYPPFFEEHIQPVLKLFSKELHTKGKYLLTHTDGENSGLLQHYLDSEIDIADSICPVPMTKLSFKEVRDVFQGKITIMGGVPSVSLLKSSMSDSEFDSFIDKFFDEIDTGDHLILGISDTTPPAAEFERILKIGKLIDEFGPVPASQCAVGKHENLTQ